MILPHQTVNGVEKVVTAYVDEWVSSLGWLWLQRLLCDGICCKGLHDTLCHGLDPGLCLPLVGLIHRSVGQ